MLTFSSCFAPKVGNTLENIKFFAKPAIGVSWFRIKSMEIDQQFIAQAPEEGDGPGLEDLASDDKTVGAKAYYTGSGLNVGVSAGIKIKSLGLGVHYSFASITTREGNDNNTKIGGYYKEYQYYPEYNAAYGEKQWQQGTIKLHRVLFELNYGLSFWKFELSFNTRIGSIKIDDGGLQIGRALEDKDRGFSGDLGMSLTLYLLDFLGFGLGGYGGFYMYSGKYEGVYGLITGLTGHITLQL